MWAYYHNAGKVADPTVLSKLLLYQGPVGCDVETISLKDRTPLGAGFTLGTPGNFESFYFSIDDYRFPWQILKNLAIPKIFHNSGFDVQILEDYGKIKINNIHDSCTMAQLLGLPSKLSALCLRLFDRPERPISDLLGTGANKINMDKVPVEKVAERACLDAEDCLEAWYTLLGMGVPQKALDLETRFLPVALQIQRRGIHIDMVAVEHHVTRLEAKMSFIRTVCEGTFGFNPGSSLQLSAWLESEGYNVPYKRGKDGKKRPNLNKNVLKRFYSTVPACVMAMEYRSAQTLLTHLVRPLYQGRYVEAGNMIYPSINTNVTSTGRLSRSNPATQNIQMDLRDIIIPKNGQVLEADFSQIELRWAAYLWEDKTMQALFKAGTDIHQGTADELIQAGVGSLLGPTPYARRQTAKIINFTLLYYGNADTMLRNNQIPLTVGTRIMDAYFTRFPGIKNGLDKTTEFALANGYTETYYGRRRDESEALDSGEEWRIQAALRALVNNPIQGSAGETMKEQLIASQHEPIFHTVHDSELLDVPVGYQYTGHLNQYTPFETPMEVKVGSNWKDTVSV